MATVKLGNSTQFISDGVWSRAAGMEHHSRDEHTEGASALNNYYRRL